MELLNEELLDEVSGGWNVDDLTPEELEEFEKAGGVLMEMTLREKNGGEKISKDEYFAAYAKVQELDRAFKKKYG